MDTRVLIETSFDSVTVTYTLPQHNDTPHMSVYHFDGQKPDLPGNWLFLSFDNERDAQKLVGCVQFAKVHGTGNLFPLVNGWMFTCKVSEMRYGVELDERLQR